LAKEITWAVKPQSLFAGVIIVVAVTAGLMVASLYIGKDLALRSRSEIPIQMPGLKPVEERLRELGRTISLLSKQPQQVNLEVPKEALKLEIALPKAPPPQPLHIHTREMQTKVMVKEVPTKARKPAPVKKAPEPAPTKKAPEPAPAKKASKKPAERGASSLKSYDGPLPPPRGTRAWKEWMAKYGSKVKEK
jgi:hypothetical protein